MNGRGAAALLLLFAVASAGCQATLDGDESTGSPEFSSGGASSKTSSEPPRLGEEFDCDPESSGPGSNLVRRLTKHEYSATVLDTLGIDVREETDSLPDLPPTARSFNNQANELTVTPSHVEAYRTLAETIVGRISDPDDFATELASCGEFSSDCERSFINALALLLFRAKAAEEEIQALSKVFTAGESEGLTFGESALYVLETMLQSPRFIYRIEEETGEGQVRPLRPYEVASRLSYAIWGTVPDQQLLDAASSGNLSTDEELVAQVDRMLEDPRAIEAGVRFLSDWFDLHRMDLFLPDPEEFPEFDPSLLPAMSEETRAAFVHVITAELPLSSLFDLQQTTVSQELAVFYGLPNPKEGITTYDLTSVPERGGILTQGAIHNIGGSESSTVRRGLFFLHEVLCGAMSSPPAEVDTTPISSSPGASVRDVSETRVNDPACRSCHSQFEPLVWGLVPFDAVGAFRTEDSFGNALPQDGFVVFPGSGEKVEYQSVEEMMRVLAESERVRDCSTLKSFSYVMGRSVSAGDSCALFEVKSFLQAGDGSYRQLLTALALSENFRHIRTEAL